MDKYEAILKLYPNTAIIRDDIAYDINNNEVVYDKALVQAEIDANSYIEKRQAEYTSFIDYLDGIVKGDQAQIDKYIADCQAIKDKYPKTSEETE
jgi:hypothetical protein